MAVTRTITLEDITPEELAFTFCEMDAGAQAEFFAVVWKVARTWPGAGWCQQSLGIVEKLDSDGRNAVATLSAHLETEAA